MESNQSRSDRPWDHYPLWKKIAISPLFLVAGIGVPKITTIGLIMSMISVGVWSFNLSMMPVVDCMEEASEGDEEPNIEEDKRTTVYESKREECLQMQDCTKDVDDPMIMKLFAKIMEQCDPYLEEDSA